MSWSDGRSNQRDSNEGKVKEETILESIRSINGLLQMLSRDEDFQDDLKLEKVKIALNHWTGSIRLPPEQYIKQLGDDSRVQKVYPKLKMFQAVCQAANILKLPIDHFILGKPKLDADILKTNFGAEFCVKHGLVPPSIETHVLKTNMNPVINSTSKLIADELKNSNFIEETKEATREDMNHAGKLIDIWRIVRESMETTDWRAAFIRVFREQLILLTLTIAVAYYFGFMSSPLNDKVRKI